MITLFKRKLNNFSALSLTELNSKASYLKRIDRKFLLTYWQFMEVLNDLKEDFQVLEIDWKRVFSYDNVYMDTPDYLFYNQHQNKLKSRTKIRTRLYKDSSLAFFEYKQKENWITKKFRYDFPVEEHGKMTKGKVRFFEWVWQSMYEWIKAPVISPAIKTKYKRITLVNKTWEERLTIDFDIVTKDLRNKKSSEVDLKNLVIIESKSLSKDCYSCNIIKSHGIAEASSCSKYSLWVVYAWLATKYDTFAETIAKIREIRLETLKNRTRQNSLKTDFRRTSLESIQEIFKEEPILKIA